MLLLALLPLWTAGQGIEFRDMPLEKALETAAKEKKMVFIDFYTTWCGPCKTLSNEVFPQKEVGDFFNVRFVSLKCDAEKGDGPALARKYGVRAYPTLAFLNADGTLAYSFAGALDAGSLSARVRRGYDRGPAPARPPATGKGSTPRNRGTKKLRKPKSHRESRATNSFCRMLSV